jgi:hypothetical protein
MQRTLAAATAAAPAARAAALSSRARVAPLAAQPLRHAAPRAVRTFAGISDTVKEKIACSPVVVFSKSYCRASGGAPRGQGCARVHSRSRAAPPAAYCVSVKALMTNLNVKATVIELDQVGAASVKPRRVVPRQHTQRCPCQQQPGARACVRLRRRDASRACYAPTLRADARVRRSRAPAPLLLLQLMGRRCRLRSRI